jgi:hypothetical protein
VLAGWLATAGALEPAPAGELGELEAVAVVPLLHALAQHPTATAAISGASDRASRPERRAA